MVPLAHNSAQSLSLAQSATQSPQRFVPCHHRKADTSAWTQFLAQALWTDPSLPLFTLSPGHNLCFPLALSLEASVPPCGRPDRTLIREDPGSFPSTPETPSLASTAECIPAGISLFPLSAFPNPQLSQDAQEARPKLPVPTPAAPLCSPFYPTCPDALSIRHAQPDTDSFCVQQFLPYRGCF